MRGKWKEKKEGKFMERKNSEGANKGLGRQTAGREKMETRKRTC